MKKFFNIIYLIPLALLLATSCTRDPAGDSGGQFPEEGAPLRISVGFEPMTRLAELPSVGEMNDAIINGKDYDLYNVGLYVYYTDDYEAGRLDMPYIRNLECRIVGNELQPLNGPSNGGSAEEVYIYDRMTVVAFYPYNAEMSLEENWFTNAAQERNYPITKRDYSEQYYIPYKAVTQTNPTVSFYTHLVFYPINTFKVEVVVVADDLSLFPAIGDVRLLPNIDPVDVDDGVDGTREEWHDIAYTEADGGGGSHIQFYAAYLWTTPSDRNVIKRGEVLMESDQLTLIASQEIQPQSDGVYRYGFNMSTGEIFIPTSSFIVHDRPTLEAVNNIMGSAYQACDIDLSVGGNWDPISLLGGRFDGGGHRIEGMVVNTSGNEGGLFGQSKGNSAIANVNLIEPSVTVNNSSPADSVYVGALCGRVNTPITEADIQKLRENLPPGLSPVVQQVLLEDLIGTLLNSESLIVACRVEDPTITVTGTYPFVGSLCGLAGDKDDNGFYYSWIRDSYVLDGSISVNEDTPANNEGGYAAGFCGLNNSRITNSFTTTGTVDFDRVRTYTDENGDPQTEIVPSGEGFGTLSSDMDNEIASFGDCYGVLPNTDAGVGLMPGQWPSSWTTYTGWWPIMYLGNFSNASFGWWYQLGSPPDDFPTLQWQRR